jgi:membrane-bound ClpP family serine protease
LLFVLSTLLAWQGGEPRAATVSPVVWQDGGDGRSTSQSIGAAAKADNLAVITLHGEINAVTPQVFRRRLERAQRWGADAIVIEINTPGGQVGAVLEICTMIKDASIPISAWINTDAFSGGAIIALACDEILVNDPSTFGDALPVLMSPLQGINSLPEAERQKIIAPLLVEVIDSARRNGYDEKLVQGVVSLGVELWMIRNKQDPTKVMFIDAAEYERIYGEEPDRSVSPQVVAAAPLPGDQSPAGTPGGNGTEGGAKQQAPASGAGSPAGQPEERESDAKFQPASPNFDGIADTVSESLEVLGTPAGRPVLGPEDADEWTPPVYYMNGRGLVVLKSDQMLAAGLAEREINDGTELKDYFGASKVVRLEPTWSEQLASSLAFVIVLTSSPIAKSFFLMVFFIGLFIELGSPGLGIPGGIALVALLAFLAPSLILGLANWLEVAAILLGMILLAVEIFVVPGFGVFGVSGLLLMLLGVVGTFVGGQGILPEFNDENQTRLLNGLVAFLLAIATSGVAIYFIAKNMKSIPVFNRLVLSGDGSEESGDSMLRAMTVEASDLLIGDVGVTTTPLRPTGNARFGDRLVEVAAEVGYVAADTRVRVTARGDFGRYLVVAAPEGDTEGVDEPGESIA